jgi:hypothetical protein
LTKVRGSPKRIREQTKSYLRENWGIPFIVAFIFLLLVAAIFLVTSNYYASIATSVTGEEMQTFLIISSNLASWAEGIGSCAYFVLVVGVVLELGKVSSNSVRKDIAQIKEFKIISKCIRFGKSRFNKGAVFHRSD